MDLAPGKSLIEWAVQHGHTCFAISYRNPDASDARPGLRRLPAQGPAGRDPGRPGDHRRPEVNTALGVPRRHADRDRRWPTTPRPATTRSTPPRSSTPTPTSPHPGALGVFTDEATIAGLEKQMAKKGYLDCDEMAHTFDASAGQRPRLPVRREELAARREAAGVRPAGVERRQHADAGQDALAIPAVVLPAQRVRARRVRDRRRRSSTRRKVDIDTYVVAAVDDHIVPWTSALQDHAAARRPQPVRAQHLRPHRRHREPARPQGQALDQRRPPADPQEWKDNAELQAGTWWEDWATGSPSRAAPRSPPRAGWAARITRRSRPPRELRAHAGMSQPSPPRSIWSTRSCWTSAGSRSAMRVRATASRCC